MSESHFQRDELNRGMTSGEHQRDEITHLKNFWSLVTLKRIPKGIEDIRVIVQVEMMKHYTRAPIYKFQPNQLEKYITKLFVKDTDYFCNKSKFLIKTPEIRAVINMLKTEDLDWHIETNLEGNSYLFVSWQHWG